MDTLTNAPTPFPIMVTNFDSLDYKNDKYAAILKQQNDDCVFLHQPSDEIISPTDKKKKMMIRLNKVGVRTFFRQSFVDKGVQVWKTKHKTQSTHRPTNQQPNNLWNALLFSCQSIANSFARKLS